MHPSAARSGETPHAEDVRSFPLPVVEFRPDTREIVAVNQAAGELLGRRRDELIGARIGDVMLVAGADGNPDGRSIAELVDPSGDPAIATVELLRGDGAIVTRRCHVAPTDRTAAANDVVVVDVIEAVDATDVAEVIDATDSDDAVAVLVGARQGTDVDVPSPRFGLLAALATCLRTGAIGWHRGVDAAAALGAHAISNRLDADVEIRWIGATADQLDDIGETGPADHRDDREPDAPNDGPERDRRSWVVSSGAAVVATIAVDDATALDDDDRDYLAGAAHHLGALHRVGMIEADTDALALYEAAFRASHVGMQIVGPDGTYLRVNQAFADMVGVPVGDLVGRSWRDYTHPDDLEPATRTSRADDPPGVATHHRVKRYLRPDGTAVWAMLNVVEVPGQTSDGLPLFVAHVTDITPQVDAAENERLLRTRLEAGEQRWRSLVEPSVDLILRVAEDGQIADVNPSFAGALGAPAAELVGRRIDDVAPERLTSVVRERVAEALQTGQLVEVWREWIEPVGQTPGWYVMRFMPEPGVGGAPADHVHLVCSDITELVESELRLEAMALVDPLTGLSNRAAVFDRLQHCIHRLQRHPGMGLAIAMIDLDHFKSLNDTFGHAAGDDALRAVAKALRATVRTQDTVGRLGGDEFVALFEEVEDRATAHMLGERLRDALDHTTFDIGEAQFTMAASVGVAYTDEVVHRDELIARADGAMYQAKTRGRNQTWSETDSALDLAPVSSFLRDLSIAMHRDQFELHYQPLTDARDGSVLAFEALLRWRHPTIGLVPPHAFLNALFRTGRIITVGRWVVHSAVARLAAWALDPATADLRLHVNVSPAELAAPGFARMLSEALDGSGVDPSRLCVEVTEQSLAGPVVSTSTLEEIAATGAGVVLDDFGTGISSLSHLRTRTLHGIKIDRSFVASAGADPRERSIVETLIALGRALHIEITAEGVETSEQAEWLAAAGCHLLQGWFVGHPVDVVAATALATSTS